MLVIRRKLQQTILSFPSHLTLPNHIPTVSLTQHAFKFSETFHRTLGVRYQTHFNTPNFPNFDPSFPHSLYDPLDFNELECKSNEKNEMGRDKIVELVRKAKTCTTKKEVIDFVGGSNVGVDENQLCLAIWALRNEWELALLAFDCCEKLGCCVSEKLLGLIVWVLGSHHKFDVAWGLIRDLHQIVGTRRGMLAIIERYAASNCHEKAIKTFHFMEKLTIHIDRSAFYTVISALCKHGNAEEAEEFMLKNQNLFPLETECFNIILHAWCIISIDIYEAKRVWRVMASYCITPNAVSYTNMISCFSKTRNLYDSLRLYDEMKRRGWTPGVEVYNSLLYVMTCENCLNEAFKILDTMKEKGFSPNSESYNCIIGPLCEAGKFEEASYVLGNMVEGGNEPTIETYHAFLKGANIESVFEILGQMKRDEVGPNCDTFRLVFDRFFELGKIEDVLKVWVEMRNYNVDINSIPYVSVITWLVNCGCLVKAEELYSEMISFGLAGDPKLEKLLKRPRKGKRNNKEMD